MAGALMAGPRNAHGVNDLSQMYRTVDGVRWEAYGYAPPADRIAAYRAIGVRCRKVGDILFMHPEDFGESWRIDDA